MKITRKSGTSSSSLLLTKSPDAERLVPGANGGSLEKVSWVAKDLNSTLDLGLSHDKNQTITIKEPVVELAHTKVRTYLLRYCSYLSSQIFLAICSRTLLNRSTSFVKSREHFKLISRPPTGTPSTLFLIPDIFATGIARIFGALAVKEVVRLVTLRAAPFLGHGKSSKTRHYPWTIEIGPTGY